MSDTTKNREALYPKFWDDACPGHGERLVIAMRRFVGYDPLLKPAPADLAERLTRAIVWRPIAGVRVFTPKSDRMYVRSYSYGLYDAHAMQFITARLGFHRLRSQLRREQELVQRLTRAIDIGIVNAVRPSFDDPLGERPLTILRLTLLAVCLFEVENKPQEAKPFNEILDLWHDGVRSVGYDGRDKVIVYAG